VSVLTTEPIVRDFLEMVAAPSHSLKERALADLCLKKLRDLGLEAEEDGAGPLIGGDAGNIVARLPGKPGVEPVLFSAHLDRVSNPGVINARVLEAEDRIVSDGTTILGADDASGLAAILDGLRRVKEDGVEHGEVELVLTVAEEIGLQGSRRLDYSKIKSRTAFVLDCAGRLGTIVNRAPTQKTVMITVRGLSSHAGIAPEAGINAIRVAAVAISRLPEGRLSPVTTSNFGVIAGGKATNIVCDLVKIKAEARSHDAGELDAYCAKLEETFVKAASEAGASAEFDWTLEYETFNVPENDRAVVLAGKAFDALGVPHSLALTGGGLDGNHFNSNGIRCVGISTGYDHVHTEKEEQSISQLIGCGKVVAEIIKAAAKA
jgi:tripeptide aminopeptidase